MKRTLEGFKEVTEVDFVPHRELFGVEYYADQARGSDFKEAVLAVVIAPGVRKMLGDIGARNKAEPPAPAEPAAPAEPPAKPEPPVKPESQSDNSVMH